MTSIFYHLCPLGPMPGALPSERFWAFRCEFVITCLFISLPIGWEFHLKKEKQYIFGHFHCCISSILRIVGHFIYWMYKWKPWVYLLHCLFFLFQSINNKRVEKFKSENLNLDMNLSSHPICRLHTYLLKSPQPGLESVL
jgi:hypothetical protein